MIATITLSLIFIVALLWALRNPKPKKLLTQRQARQKINSERWGRWRRLQKRMLRERMRD